MRLRRSRIEFERAQPLNIRKGDDTVGNPHRAQVPQFELFELILLLKFEATSSQSTVPSPPLSSRFV